MSFPLFLSVVVGIFLGGGDFLILDFRFQPHEAAL